ncbi:hypothetical protein FRB94_002576 [Tulasnella sp. JGI-2019a]|nr:hypothetical protein FRB93_004923 [Tulasnella sp. JGI-2019a]KAG9004220.1 hypothetical protein FRB94_002576 [Tulasnella sp. JGI-2019a]
MCCGVELMTAVFWATDEVCNGEIVRSGLGLVLHFLTRTRLLRTTIMDEKLTATSREEAQSLLLPHDAEKGEAPETARFRPAYARFPWMVITLCLFIIPGLHHWASDHHRDEWDLGLDFDQSSHQWALDAFDGKRMTLKDAEKLFLSVPSPASALNTAKTFASVPHLAGSVTDFLQAETILTIFQNELGIAPPETLPLFEAGSEHSRNATLSMVSGAGAKNAWIDTYFPVMNTPLERHLQIIDEDGGVAWDADVEEEEVKDDPAGEYAKTIGAWHGLSKGGDVKGKLVYVNYGRKEDFDHLAALGVNLTGTIVLARYGGVFRGLKVKGAQEAGAVGCVIYNDLRDDGTVTEENGYKPYPAGPARNPNSVQRGSVQFISKYPGDPATPGYPAYKNATRISRTNVPSIPSLPISWNNAKKLLAEISSNSTDAFTLDGKLSERTVRLNNQVNDGIMPIWNTMAVVPGHVRNEIVIVGCHRDAWVLGAADPTSGTAALVEVVKGFGELLRKGWKPLKTVVFASWDAEEYGLIGSTEWAEDFPDFIADHVVSYLNTDVASSGSQFRVGGSPTLAHLLRGAAQEIPHPTDAGRTLWDARMDRGKLKGPPTAQSIKFEEMGIDWQNEELMMASLQQPENTGVFPLGSGSDFTVFLQRIGVASSGTGFASTHNDPVYHYHSVYDSLRFQELYADPGYVRHTALAKHLGLVALRLVQTPLLPLNTTQYALELFGYLEKVQKIASLQNITVEFSPLHKAIHSVAKASAKLDESKARAVHKLEKAISDLEKHKKKLEEAHKGCATRSWRRTREWIKSVFGVKSTDHQSAKSINLVTVDGATQHSHHHHGGHESHKHNEHHKEHKKPKIPKAIRRVMKAAQVVVAHNKKLSSFEQGFISEEGIKDREWYRNLVVAPGKWTGYGATTFPALSEAIEVEKNATLANHEVERLSNLLVHLADNLHVRKGKHPHRL